MSTYAIGDLQGCYDALSRLLDHLDFDPACDQLWFTGDLVNRGPQSLRSLRFVRDLGPAALTVLGNHDLHLLAVANGGRSGRRDTLQDILHAPDREQLLDWLRCQPLLHEDTGLALLHAGLPPQWDLPLARRCAREVEAVLRGPGYVDFLRDMYGDDPVLWDDGLSGTARLRFIINCFTRMRYCDARGRVDLEAKGAPGSQPEGLVPWFAHSQRRSCGATLIFGHWSTLGRVHWPEHRVYGLDTGAVWGGKLSALRLEDWTLHSVDSPRP